MAKCAYCEKKTAFGRNRPWSKKATRRVFKPNLQKVSVIENGQRVQRTLCTRCIRSLGKVS